MESYIKIRATIPEMNDFFVKERGVRFMEIRDPNYTSDEIDNMPEDTQSSTIFTWFVILRHREINRELRGTFKLSTIKKKLEQMKKEPEIIPVTFTGTQIVTMACIGRGALAPRSFAVFSMLYLFVYAVICRMASLSGGAM